MNLMLRTIGGKATPAPEEKRQREREVVKKILEENDKFRTRMGFFDSGEPRPDQTVDLAKHLHIYPDEIIFKDIAENQTYEINIMVRNLTKAVKRIRVVQPTTKKFRCDYDMAGLLAPGLAIELVVSFSTSTSGQFHDKIVILSDLDYRCEVPLHAYSPMANIIFEPFVNMGFIQVGQQTKYKMLFTNEGSLDGAVELRYSDLPDFKIEPKPTFKVKGSGGQQEIDLVYQPREAGIFRGIIEVYQEGQSFMNHIDVNATSVEFLKFIVDTDGNELTKVDFGSVFFGQKREIKGFLVNNSPRPFKFKVNYLHGLHNVCDDETNLKTPAEEGHQQTQRVMTISPNEGVIDTYSQIPVTFYCHSKVQEDHVIWVRNNCFRKSKAEPKIMQHSKKFVKEEEPDFDEKSKKNHDYTAVFHFGDSNDKKTLMMTATCICPKVSFGEESHFDFGTIRANETEVKTLDVSNMHTNMDVVIDFPNVSVFFVEPSRISLKAGEKTTVKIIFRPRSLGKFIRKVDFMINKKFNVPITLVGIASQIALKNKKPTGPLQVDFDTYNEKKYLEKMEGHGEREETEFSDHDAKLGGKGARDLQKGRSKTAYPYKPNPRLMKVADTTNETQLPHVPFGTHGQDNFADHQIQKHNTQIANDYLTDQRKDREMMKKKGYIVGQNKMRKDRIGFYTGKASQTATDGFYTAAARQERLERPTMNIPMEADTLFVMNPISVYEPYPMYDLSANFSPDVVNPVPFPEQPETHAETRDVTAELTGEELQKIPVGPTVIDFGSIYQKSTEKRYFQIKNDLRKPIKVKLSIDNNTELIESYQKTQVVPSGKSASILISFCSLAVMHNYSRLITYTINDKHPFKINVKADVTQVNLKLSKTEEEFQFEDEQLDMQLVKEILVRNDGNAAGCFEWRDSRTGCFTVEPKSGEVGPRSFKTVKVIYTPSGTKLVEEDDLVMTVLDGQHEILSCKAILNEVKCEFSNKVIDFGIMCVSERRMMSTLLNNDLMKSSVVFQVDTASLPPGLEISPLNDRIPPGSPMRFELMYCNPNEVSLHNREVKINLRGAPPALLNINAVTIFPNVRIKEEEFNFGEVTFGNTESLKMTLINESDIDIVLTLDLREQESVKESELYSRLGIQCREGQEGEDEQILEEKDLDDIAKTDFKSFRDMNNEELGDENSEEEANQREAPQTEGSRFYTIKLKKRKSYEFDLRFSPKLGQKNPYSFNLPIKLANFEPQSLKRRVHCRGIYPKLTMEPMSGEVVFEKKIITSLDAVVPQHASITFTNSQQSKPLQFRIDTTVLEKREIFTVIPTQGTIDPQVPVTIKVSFKPQGNEKYTEELPLYIEEESKPYTMIKLVGEGAYPKLLFDRREVIMPIVPLGIESKCSFKIENEGYQNLILKHYLAQDIGAIKLKVETPEGKTLGSGTNVIRVDLSFVNEKPISFTTKLIFEDESKQIYPIFVSGTTDNSILTNYPFFLVKGDEYKPVAETNKSIRLEVVENDLDSQLSPMGGGNFQSKGGSVGSKSIKSSIGFQPIRMDDLERSCRHCRDWLNNYVLSVDIENFPGDVIESNGKEIYELIAFLTKRNPPQMLKIDPTLKKHLRVEQIHKQYSDLIRHLKEAGAMLNTIRPEFLLSQSELTTYYKKNYNNLALPHANRVSSNHFKYLSLDAWSTLFYQILKVYYECRVTPRVFKAMKELPTNLPLLPDFCQEPNQIYNQAELILLRWVELAIMTKYKSLANCRPINFEDDLRSGIGIGCLLHMYLEGPNSIKKALNTRASINSIEDMKYNYEKIRTALREFGITTPPEVFEQEPSAREMLVYLIHLFQVLPYFIPRSTLEFPVMLKGTCVRTIMLSNNSKRKICYSVKLDCPNEDFSIEKNLIEIEPGANVSFPVKYFARISRVNNARITFRNKRETGPQATPLAFDLVSEVQGRHNEEVIKVEEDVQLYEPIMVEIPVKNPYNQQVSFSIKIENIPMVVEDNKKKRIGKKGGQDERVFIPAFFCKQDSIQIGKQATGKLHLHYVPVTLEQHKCHIIFTDERVGEMQYEIQGEPKMPAPIPLDSKSSRIVCQLDNLEPIKLDISKLNTKMDFAFSKLKEKVRESKSMVPTARNEILKKIDSVKDNLTFYLECDQPYVQVPTTFNLNPSKKHQEQTENSRMEKTDTMMSMSEASNQLQVNLLYKFPVQNQPATILMRNSTRTDVRVYQLDITVSPKKVRALLEMTTPARIPITQNIPLINTLDSDVSVKVVIERIKHGEGFKVNVQEGTTFKVGREPYQLRLTYEPEWTYESQARMVVTYKETNEVFEYELRGKGEEPLAEKEIVIDCKLKEEKVIEIGLEDIRRPNATYHAEIDLPHYASGPETIEVHHGKPAFYPLKINALLGGEFTGSLTLKNDAGMYWWYMITLKVESSKFERHLDMTTYSRKAVVQEIELENPINENVNFKVSIDHDNLSGHSTVAVLARSVTRYQLTFLPLSEFKEKTSVTFMNQKIGDVVYEIQLESELPPQVKLNTMRCEVGKTEKMPITLTNVIKEPARVTARPLISQNFYLEVDQFVIPPMGSYTVNLIYIPTDLDKQESALIVFESKEIGSWNYKATGIGIPPTKFPEHKITGSLNNQSSNSIVFRNPFRDRIAVSVSLEAEGKNKDVFELVMKKNKETIGSMQSIDLNFNFLPQEITDYKAEIVVQMNEKVAWRFPILAVTESVNHDCNIRLLTKCHQRVDLCQQLKLPGVTNIDEGEEFEMKIVIANKEINPILEKWIEKIPIKKTISHPEDKLRYELRFLPHKPFKSVGEIIIIKPSGGRWR